MSDIELWKWVANHNNLLSQVPGLHVQSSSLNLDLDHTVQLKFLGWDGILSYSLCFSESSTSHIFTKRVLLSEMSKIFDSLAFITPVSLFLKIPVWQLCTIWLDWDENIPQAISNTWNRFKLELLLLTFLSICVKSCVSPLKRISIPRLELCSALLLSRLVKFVLNIYISFNISRLDAWTDSIISL